MKVILLFGVLLGTALCASAQIGIGSLLKPDTIACSVNYELLEWSDSIEYQFIAISVQKPTTVDPFDSSMTQSVHSNYYYDYIAHLYIKDKECRLYPALTMNERMFDSTTNMFYESITGYFLVDDFKNNLDSLEITQLHYSGYHLQSNMNSYEVKTKVAVDFRDIPNVNVKKATNKWFQTWTIQNPKVYNVRREQRRYGGCE